MCAWWWSSFVKTRKLDLARALSLGEGSPLDEFIFYVSTNRCISTDLSFPKPFFGWKQLRWPCGNRVDLPFFFAGIRVETVICRVLGVCVVPLPRTVIGGQWFALHIPEDLGTASPFVGCTINPWIHHDAQLQLHYSRRPVAMPCVRFSAGPLDPGNVCPRPCLNWVLLESAGREW